MCNWNPHRKRDAEKCVEEILAENFPNWMKNIDPLVQNIQRTTNTHMKKTTPRNIIIKLFKTSDKRKKKPKNRKKGT